MDVKDIIKWLLSCANSKPCIDSNKCSIVVLCVLLTVQIPFTSANKSLNTYSVYEKNIQNKREIRNMESEHTLLNSIDGNVEQKSDQDIETGRTFGRPIRKLQAALLPIMFKLGVLATLIVLTFVLVAKGVGMGLLLMAFKAGGFLAKLTGWHDHGSGHPHKEIHLHVVGQPSGYGWTPPHYPSGHEAWNRLDNGTPTNYVQNLPQRNSYYTKGPSSINTPYGHYVRTGDPTGPSVR